MPWLEGPTNHGQSCVLNLEKYSLAFALKYLYRLLIIFAYKFSEISTRDVFALPRAYKVLRHPHKADALHSLRRPQQHKLIKFYSL